MISRRHLLAAASATVVASTVRAADAPKLRAVIIGHTGKGDYGHGLDLVFKGRDDIELAAVADPSETGRTGALKKTGAARAYADWREMLDKEKPQLVSIAPRMTPHRREMLLGALEAGAHVVSEKPFVQCPLDGDEVLAPATKKNLRIAVMHQMRLAPAVVHLKKKLADGALGELIEMRAWGKQDRRAGGEDLVVLGVHLFDLMRLFAGDPQWCSARVMEKGREATANDARTPGEDLGPILGDEIDAQFAFDKGVFASFTSRGRLRDVSGYWGIELVGTKACARILADIWPRVHFKTHSKWEDAGRSEQWKPFDDDASAAATAAQRSSVPANARVADDWLAAIREGRDPVCSGANAARAVEMVHAVWQSGIGGSRVKFPLQKRGHCLKPE